MTAPTSLFELLLQTRQCSIQLDKVRRDLTNKEKDFLGDSIDDIERDLYLVSVNISEAILELY
ncbi:MAG: hypothetical protein ACI3Z0_03225 [Candidatus Cryptobacteroides sp.]